MDISTARLLLEVGADATKDDIKKAFRKKIKSEHPDQSDSEDANERAKRIQEAKDELLSYCDETNTVGTKTTSTGSNQSESSNSEQRTRTTNSSQSQSRSQSTSNSTGSYSRKQDNTESHQTRSDHQTGEETRSSNTSKERQSSKTEPEGGYSTSSGENVSQTRRMFQTDILSLQTILSLIVGLLSLVYIGAFVFMVATQLDIQTPVFSGILSWGLIWMITSVLLGISLRYNGVDIFMREGLIVAVWPLVTLAILFIIGDIQEYFEMFLDYDSSIFAVIFLWSAFVFFPALVAFFPALIGLFSLLRQIVNYL